MKETNYATLPPTLPRHTVWKPLDADTELFDPDEITDEMSLLALEQGTMIVMRVGKQKVLFQLPDGYAICKRAAR